jgi:predicted RNA-binding protein with PUA-like domain
MSEQLKYELAKDLGFYDTVQKEGWSGIRAKDAGNMVKRAVQIAERTLLQQSANPQTQAPSQIPNQNQQGARGYQPYTYGQKQL